MIIFKTQGHVEDALLRLQYLYYVEKKPAVEDLAYDRLKSETKKRWSISMVTHGDNRYTYPAYIVDGHRPNGEERLERDKAIIKRWLDNL